MISSLTGLLAEAEPPTVLLECHGVGYEVWIPTSNFASLPILGTQLRLHTSLIVREDSHSLYGFLEVQERNLFNCLIRISGIGAKSALALLSSLDAPTLAQAVENSDVKSLTRAPGIGRKNAERILIELRDNSLLMATPAVTPILSRATEALVALGYPVRQVRAALASVKSEKMDVADLVKAGLAKLNSSSSK